MLFFTLKGTVFANAALWVEQLIIIILYLGMATAVHFFEIHDESSATGAGSFADKMATLAAFLLGFYTSLTVSRWWRLRTNGVGNIWSASSQLSAVAQRAVKGL